MAAINLRKGLVISVLGSMLSFNTADGLPDVSLDRLLSGDNPQGGEPSSLTTVVEDPKVGPRFEPIAYHHKKTKVEEIQTYIPPESVVITQGRGLVQEVRDLRIANKLMYLVMGIHESPEFKSKGLRNMLEEAYKEFRKEYSELSNKDVYYKFFEAYFNAHLPPILQYPQVDKESRAILPVLIKHPKSRRVTSQDVRFNRDGTWEVVRFELMPEFRGNDGKLSDFYRKALDKVPIEFIAPEVAGLQSPFQARYWFLNRYYKP